jgi:hypothetical protein
MATPGKSNDQSPQCVDEDELEGIVGFAWVFKNAIAFTPKVLDILTLLRSKNIRKRFGWLRDVVLGLIPKDTRIQYFYTKHDARFLVRQRVRKFQRRKHITNLQLLQQDTLAGQPIYSRNGVLRRLWRYGK